MRLQALRGATTCNEDSKAEIDAKTPRAGEGALRPQRARRTTTSSASSSPPTPDLNAQFPATAARPRSASTTSPLLGAQEQAVAHGTPRCIRVLVHCYTERPRDELHHVFLEGAAALRTDLAARRRLTRDAVVAPKSVALDRHRADRRLDRPRAAPRRRRRARLRPRRRPRRPPRSRWARSTRSPPSVADAVAGADLIVIAVPVGHVAEVVLEALDAGAALVTDVGSVKAPVVAAVEAARPELAPRFVGGHPMAGSEQEGLAGASADLFVGATWVLTPTGRTDPEAFAEVRSWVAGLGAEAIAVTPELHDALVAVVSHVPQLAASTLMNVAAPGNDEHAVLLRLAAGGFRDMTRIASSHPRSGPTSASPTATRSSPRSTSYLDELTRVRAIVAGGDRDGAARAARAGAAARGATCPPACPSEEHAGRAAHPGARPRGRDRRGHDARRRASA